MSSRFKSRLWGFVRRLQHGWNHVTWRREQLRNQEVFCRWIQSFRDSTAQVIIGANFNDSGGVRHHIHAIKKFSALRTELVPDDELLLKFGTTPFNNNIAVFHQTPPPQTTRAVHTHVLPWLIDWVIANRRSDVRWVHTHHSWYFPEFGWRGLEPWQHELNEVGLKALRNCDVALSVSKSQQRFLRTEHGIETIYLPNGVDVSLCDLGNAERFLRRHTIQQPFVLWVGRHDPVKNPADFVRLASALPEYRFVMAGGVTDQDLTNDLGLQRPANLKLLPLLSHLEVQDALAACRLLVVTSHREGLPTLVLEGMAHRKPLVIPQEAGCMDATNGDEFASVYRIGNISDLASKVQAAYSAPRIRDDSRNLILAEFDWRVVARKLDQLYLGEGC